MVQTNTQYMSEPARAERIMRNFGDVTFRELRNERTKKYMDYIIEEMVRKEHLSVKKLQDMTYMELACLIDNVGGNSDYNGFDYDSYDRQLCYYRMIACTLVDKSIASIPVRMFLALPLKTFYGCLNGISPQSGMWSVFETVKGRCSYTKDYTVRDYLSEKIEALSKAWVPVVSYEWYKDNIINKYEDIGKLLVGSFYMAFPEKFQAESVCRKYREASVVKKTESSFM